MDTKKLKERVLSFLYRHLGGEEIDYNFYPQCFGEHPAYAHRSSARDARLAQCAPCPWRDECRRLSAQRLALKKPRCFGLPQFYAAEDQDCRDCRWKATCRVIVKNKGRGSPSLQEE